MIRKRFLSIATFVLSLLLFDAVVFATPAVLEPNTCETKNIQTNQGWYWLRTEGDSVRWVFNPLEMSGGIVPKSLFLMVHAKVTNGLEGGSGYETTLNFKVSGNGITKLVKVRLHNPFRPVDPEPSGGIGYDAYGWGGPILDRIWQGAEKIVVEMEYMPKWQYSPKGNIQVAFDTNPKSNSLNLGYMR